MARPPRPAITPAARHRGGAVCLPRSVAGLGYRHFMTTWTCRRICVGGVLAAVCALMVACGTSTEPATQNTPEERSHTSTSQTPMVLPTSASVNPDRTDPLAVMLAMCEIVFTRDASQEPSYSSSYQRAADLMTPGLRTQLLQPAKAVRPLPQWVQWQNQNAHIRGGCAETADQHPADTADRRSRVLAVTESVTSSSGDVSAGDGAAVWATTSRVGGAWAVSRFDVHLNE